MCPERVSKLAMLERVRFIGLGCLVLGIVMPQTGGVSAQTTDALSVVKGFFAAQCVPATFRLPWRWSPTTR